MVDFTVFDNSATSALGLQSWLDIPEIAVAEPHLLITKCGNLVDWLEYSTKVFQSLQELCLERFYEDQFWGPFPIRVWHENHKLVGNAVSLEYTNQMLPSNHPNAFGDIENQAADYTTLTVYAPKRIITRIHTMWSETIRSLSIQRQTAVLFSRSRPAIQIHAYNEEFTFSDHIDVTLEALKAIRNIKDSGVVLGRSCTIISGVPMKKRTVSVEQFYGPFDIA